METDAKHSIPNGKPMATDDSAALLDLLPTELREDLRRSHAIKKSRQMVPVDPEDPATDWTWLFDFEHQGKRLTAEEIQFIVAYAGTGFGCVTSALRQVKNTGITKKCNTRPKELDMAAYALSATVQAALATATRNAVKTWQSSLPKVHDTMVNILDAKVSDVMDVSAAGIVLKDFSEIPPEKLAAIQEIHEQRNAAGTQIRVKFYDKIAAATVLSRMLGGFAPEKLEVSVDAKGFEQRLANALSRIGKDPDPTVIEGELVEHTE